MTKDSEGGVRVERVVRRGVFFVVWWLNMFFAAHNAIRQNWGAAIFFLGFLVLIELAEANGRLSAIQRDVRPTRIDIA
jgi:hypothetical protein